MQACYDLVWKVSGYLIFVTAILQIVPGEKERRYIQFFTGLVLILLVASALLGTFSAEDVSKQFQKQYESMEENAQEILEKYQLSVAQDEMMDGQENMQEDSGEAEKGVGENAIRVEEIRIGHEGETP